jgi:pyruvate formate lyase activating enzyme
LTAASNPGFYGFISQFSPTISRNLKNKVISMITRRKMCLYTGAAIIEASVPFKRAAAEDSVKNALFWHPKGDTVVCDLCPHSCILAKGKTGRCRTRQNSDGKLITHAYANPCAQHVDPIEKKPFFHFIPATKAYSLAIAGCNLRCLNCQNYSISQRSPDETDTEYLPPQKAILNAKTLGCASIAYTYSEPTVWFEYMYDTAQKAHEAGLKNVMVTSGFINEAPLKELLKYMDAVTIDIKSFSNDTYQKLNAGKLEPVLRSLETVRKSGMWLEVSTLVVPGWSDDQNQTRKLCAWIKSHLGGDTPMHFLRFFPVYKLANLYPTPTQTLLSAQKIAQEEGLQYAYVGNIAEADSNTYCPSCKKPLIVRDGFLINKVDINNGLCAYCKTRIGGVWEKAL